MIVAGTPGGATKMLWAADLSVADITSPASLLKVRAHKKEMKAAAKATASNG